MFRPLLAIIFSKQIVFLTTPPLNNYTHTTGMTHFKVIYTKYYDYSR